MIHAYNEFYMPYTRRNLGAAFEIASRDGGYDLDEFVMCFNDSVIAKGIEKGDPHYLVGISGVDIVNTVLDTDLGDSDPLYHGDIYWTGYVYAQTQWMFDRRFTEIQDAYPCSKLRSCYRVYHEMDDSHILEFMGKKLVPENIIKSKRKKSGMTQSDLSKATGISLGTIRAYEQGVLSIENAPVRNAALLSRALGVSIEDLMHGQMSFE